MVLAAVRWHATAGPRGADPILEDPRPAPPARAADRRAPYRPTPRSTISGEVWRGAAPTIACRMTFSLQRFQRLSNRPWPVPRPTAQAELAAGRILALVDTAPP